MLWLGFLVASLSAQAERFAISHSTGKIRFHMEASLHEIDGAAESFSGGIELGPESSHQGEITIPAVGLTTHLKIRDERMREHVLHVEKYPTITYRIRSISGDVAGLDSGTGSGEVQLNGDLTVAGVTETLNIPAAYTWSQSSVKLVGKVTTKWTNFRLPDPSILISTLHPPLDILFAVQATKEP